MTYSKDCNMHAYAVQPRSCPAATPPILTSAAKLQEAEWLLENHEIILRMVKDGDLRPALDYDAEDEVGLDSFSPART